ncbi:MAG: peptidase M23 [Microbacterium sp. SCN 70-27]|uniref:M23 family metallopeptidase n=1 Tax=unclassified Microbacterium TaxID=2609290 RepID=UPI00086EA13B|nr:MULTISPECIES: M23 family metallopeptidase [unclassified Microbacterium]MBN9223969.1 M23 family metallopeptidase [Microbacterium sp.]ODT28470.1 MAG: peptidase M23 [Microbacterium sp. SCN 70-27]
MTLDSPTGDAVPERSADRLTSAPSAPEVTGVLTRAEYRRRAAAAAAAGGSMSATDATQAAPEPSLAETVVADVAAAILAESVGAEPDLPARLRLRHAAQAVFAEVATHAAAPAEDAPAAHTPVEPGSTFAGSADGEASDLDEFERAARLFSFTGETPIQRPAPTAPQPAAAGHVPPRRSRRGVVAQRIAAASFSLGVMTIVGLLAVGTTTPAEALASATSAATTTDLTTVASTTAPKGEIQAFVAGGGNDVASLGRPEGGYNVASMADVAAAGGVTEFAGTWVSDPTAPIQWPFPVGVPISAAYGSVSYLAQFSSPHRGVDLTPGLGADIQVIAAGTVRIATEAGGDYGVTVVVDHIIDGQLVSTRYGHMLHGSLAVKVGDTVTAGQVIGRVGQTGKATGPHLHFEVLLGGSTHTDPMPWMYEHTKGHHTVG